MPPVSFALRCSREIFSAEEIETLERYGRQFEDLTAGHRPTRTPAQQRFVEVAQGQRPPETYYERVWCKYLARLKWESDPRNRAAMGPPRKAHDDREDWKRMRSAAWGDAMRRARGLDD